MKKPQRPARLVASLALCRVLHHGESLDKALQASAIETLDDARDNAFARSLTYGVLRWYHHVEAILAGLLDKPLAGKHADLRCLLLVALYQMAHTEIAPHAVVSESVNAALGLRKDWARGLINAVLRNYQRNREEIEHKLQHDPVARTSHPQWLLDMLRDAWPDHWQAITEANNRQAPMTLRVNTRLVQRDDYLAELELAGIHAQISRDSPVGLTLNTPRSVETLPGFCEGRVSVQDIAPQLAADLLDARPGMNVLDACAAPGGKTAHLLERSQGQINLTAIEVDAKRARRIEETLQRLSLQARVMIADASQPDQWWDGHAFERILLDAPCSGTGVIRRHPDIKLLRRRSDIEAYTHLQMRLLSRLWPLLLPGGKLLYATCSILPLENARLVSDFISTQDDAQEDKIHVNCGHMCDTGIQIFPGTNDMDGFFYARLVKNREQVT